MQYSYKWLKELSGTKKSPEQLAKLLLTHTFEVEGIERYVHHLDGVVVGKITKLEQHPNADKLRVAEVQCGKNDIRQIVCGAPNVALGQKVAVALAGAVLPGGIVIQETKIRGTASQGMMCSAQELGLGDDHTGILVLPEETPIGAPFAKYFALDDALIDVKILPDRGSDALAYEGMAREIAALDGHTPSFGASENGSTSKRVKPPVYNRAPKITINDKQACLRYIGIAFKDVMVRESPLWLKIKLILSGVRPINNIVDITNYLMLLTGQPLHSFDSDTLAGGIIVRRAKHNEKLVLLDGTIKKLVPEDLVIADAKKALALAGVMGGKNSAITETTKNIFLEIATFDAATIRRTRTHHRLSTDASYRFERGLDPNLPERTAHLAIKLLMEQTAGKYIGMRDVYPHIAKPWKISLTLKRVESVLGIKIPLFEVVRSLALLGLTVKKIADREMVEVTVPTRRPDLCDEWNLIEEIGRMRGYDKIPAVAPTLPLTATVKNNAKHFERSVKEYLSHSGFDELMTYSVYGERDQAAACLPRAVHLALENPLSPEQVLLRMTLAPTVLRKVRENLRHFDTFNCFEWGSVFRKGEKKQFSQENKSLLLVVVRPKKHNGIFFDLKGSVLALGEALHIGTMTFEPLNEKNATPETAMLHPSRSAVCLSDGVRIGSIGELHPAVARDYGIEARVAFVEFDVPSLMTVQKPDRVFIPLQKFPFAVRDISLVFPRVSGKSITVAEVEALLAEGGAPLLKHSTLFDVYDKGEEKSLAFHLFFGADDRTLSTQEMDRVFDHIVLLAKERFGAYLRA